MDLRDAIRDYLHPTWKVVELTPGSKTLTYHCDNYHLNNAEYHLRLHLLGLKDEDHAQDCYNFIRACEVKPGLYSRFPGRNTDDISQDEIYGIAFLSYLYGWPFAERLLDWGYRHFWCYNLAHPERFDDRYWYMRHPAFKPFLHQCAKKTVILHHQLQWSGALLDSSSAPYGDTYGKEFMHLQAALFYKRHWITDWGIRRWQKEMKKIYPRGLLELDSIYFPNHPFSQYAPQDFEFKEIEPA